MKTLAQEVLKVLEGTNMYCYNCGKELTEDDISSGECKKCGHEIDPDEIGA
jgi:predicted RNA-binding Zn-ribbon protein involved in translation (DUF1610 family)